MKNVSFWRNGKEFEPTKDELKMVLDDYAEKLAIAKTKLAEKEEQLRLAKMSESFEQEKKNNALQFQTQTAIDELEKVKESVLKIDKTEIKTLENGYSTLYVDRSEIITIINQQIKSLKGEKNGN